MLKISATQLESYRRFIDGKISVEQFENSLLRRDAPNELMKRGTLFHKMLQSSDSDLFANDFSENCIKEARKKMDYRNCIFEMKTRKIFRTSLGDIAVTGVADQILGFDVVEIKTKYSPIDWDSYYNSMQWRVYCELFHADFVHYKVFHFDSPEAMDFRNYSEMTFPKPFQNYDKVRTMIYYLQQYIQIRGLHDEPELQLGEGVKI